MCVFISVWYFKDNSYMESVTEHIFDSFEKKMYATSINESNEMITLDD